MATTIYTQSVAVGDARREGRSPNHDGEYVEIYWVADGTGRWAGISNSGLCCCDAQGWLDAVVAANEKPSDEDLAIDAEIAELVSGPGLPEQIVQDPRENCSHDAQWWMIDIIGWTPETPEEAE